MADSYIWVTAQREMIHEFPGAPKGVEFLSKGHRHIFKFRVWCSVIHNDREIEFILFKRFIEGILLNWSINQGVKSCEDISDKMYELIQSKYPKRKIMIEVSEDGENGSYKIYNREP